VKDDTVALGRFNELWLSLICTLYTNDLSHAVIIHKYSPSFLDAQSETNPLMSIDSLASADSLLHPLSDLGFLSTKFLESQSVCHFPHSKMSKRRNK
jgi:hypothetical protein